MRLLAAAALVSTAFALPSALEPRTPCVNGVHVIAVGGQGTVQGDLGYLQTLVTNITSKIPHSDFQQIGFPAGVNGSAAILYAIPLFQQAIESYAVQCPQTKIVLASYSIGGSTDMDVLCGAAATAAGQLPGTYIKNILANVVYGDLTYVPGLPYDVGTCTTAGGLVARVDPSACDPYGSITHSYCDENDINCCSGDSLPVHFEYPEKYDLVASQWVADTWNAYRNSPAYKGPKKSTTVSSHTHKPTHSMKPKTKTSTTTKHKPKPKTTTTTTSSTSKPHPKPTSHPAPKKPSPKSGSQGSNGSNQGTSGTPVPESPQASAAYAKKLANFLFNYLKNLGSK